jgi:hypothetical protein
MAHTDAVARLGLYAMAECCGQHEVASAQLEAAAARLAQGSRTDRQIAAWFTAAEPPTLAATHRVVLASGDRRLVLLALGARFADTRSQWFAEAQRLNFERDDWHLAVARLATGH